MNTTTPTLTSSSKTPKPNPPPTAQQKPTKSSFFTPLRRIRGHRRRTSLSKFLSSSASKKCVSLESKSDINSDNKRENLPERESFAERHRRTMSKLLKAKGTNNDCRTPKPSAHTPDCKLIAKEESKGNAETKDMTEFIAREKKLKDNERKLREEISALKLELERLKKEASLDNALIVKEYAKLRKDQASHAKQVESLELKQQEMSARLRDFCSFQKNELYNIEQRERMLEVKRNDVKKMKVKMEKLQKKLRIEKQNLEKERTSFKCEKESFEEEREKIRANMELLSNLGVDSIGDSFVSTLAKRRLKNLKRQPVQREADRTQLYRQQKQLSVELENVRNQQRQLLSEHQINAKARAQLADAKKKLANHVKQLLEEQSKASTKVKQELEKLQKDREILEEKVVNVDEERKEILMRRWALFAEVEREKNELSEGFEKLRKEQKEWKLKMAAERSNTVTKEKPSQNEIVEFQHHSLLRKIGPQSLFDRAEEKFAEVQKNEQVALKQQSDMGVAQQMQEEIATADFLDKSSHLEVKSSTNHIEEDIDELVRHIKRLRSGE